MTKTKIIGKREFIQHTSKYLKWVEENDKEIIITHLNKPNLILAKIKFQTFKDMAGFTEIKIQGDINEHVLPGYDER